MTKGVRTPQQAHIDEKHHYVPDFAISHSSIGERSRLNIIPRRDAVVTFIGERSSPLLRVGERSSPL